MTVLMIKKIFKKLQGYDLDFDNPKSLYKKING